MEYRPTLSNIWPQLNESEWSKFDFYRNAYKQMRETGVPKYMEAKIKVPSSLNYDAWDHALRNYKDREICQFLHYGWPANYSADEPPQPAAVNHSTALQFPKHIQELLELETRLGALLGPVYNQPFKPWTQISPLLTREKKGTNRRWVIIDLSYPKGNGVNDGIVEGNFQGKETAYRLPREHRKHDCHHSK